MKNKKVLMAIGAGIAIAAAIIAWLMFGGKAPTDIKLDNGINAQLNASLKNSVISREKDGQKLWEFTVGEVINDKLEKKALLINIKGKVYRNDGSYLDIEADSGSMVLGENNFVLSGSVRAEMSAGGKLLADEVAWLQDKEQITASGNVKLYKEEWFASADKAVTTSEFKKIKLAGNAKVEKGGENNVQ